MKHLIIFAFVLVSLTGFANAQQQRTEAQQRTLAAAEQRAAVATCRVEWLRKGGRGSSSREFYSHMVECLSKSASN